MDLRSGNLLTTLAADTSRLDRIYQYALAIAAQADDPFRRELGPIHLLKYAYLGDLAFAAEHEGQTYSGTDWRFYHFGPWNEAAFERIRPAVELIDGRIRNLTSADGSDFARYGLSQRVDEIALRLEKELPLEVTRAVRREVREHGVDTESLLRHVYLTAPMLAARPSDLLDFRTVTKSVVTSIPPAALPVSRSKSEKRRRSAIIENARQEVQKRLAAKARRGAVIGPVPRFDEVFFRGTDQLDRLAGAPVAVSEGDVVFDESVWHSDQRRGPGVS